MSRTQRTLLSAYVILGTTLVAYIPAIQAGFIWDDDHLLWRSETMKADAREAMKTIWLSVELPDYYPITWSSLYLEHRAYQDSAMGYHVSNVVQQALAAILLWMVLLRLKVPGAWLAGLIFAIHPVNVASVAWVVERKNTLSILFYLLAVYLYLRYDEDRGTGREWQWYGGAIASFGLGLLCKTSIVVLPLVLVACVWWRRREIAWLDLLFFVMVPMALLLGGGLTYFKDRLAEQRWKGEVGLLVGVLGCGALMACLWRRRAIRGIRVVLENIPFFLLATVASVGSVWFQYNRAIKETTVRTEGLVAKLASAGAAVWFYLYKALVPLDLSMVYTRWDVNPHFGSSLSLLWLVPGAALIACFVFLWRRRQQGWVRPVLFAASYFVIALLPVLGFFDIYFMVYSLVADHWQHLAIIGIVALATGGAAWAAGRWPRGAAIGGAVLAGLCAATLTYVGYEYLGGTLGPWGYGVSAAVVLLGAVAAAWTLRRRLTSTPNLTASAALIVVVTLGVLTLDKTRVYKNEGTLWHDTIPRNPTCWIAQYNLGTYYSSTLGQLEKGLPYLRRAVELNPDYPAAQNNMGLTLQQLGKPEEAIPYYEKALKLKPYYPEAHFNMGLALDKLGQVDKALDHYRAAERLKPNYPEVLFSMAISLEKKGELLAAANMYYYAIKGRPDLNQAYLNLGALLIRLSQQQKADPNVLRKAVDYLVEAVNRMPENPEAALNLGLALDKLGRTDQAITFYQRALQLRGGNYDEAHNNLGIIYARIQDFPRAAQHFEAALRINPRHSQAWNNYGVALDMAGKVPESAECFRRSLLINPGYPQAHVNMARVMLKLRQPDAAIEHAQAALQLIPGLAEAQEMLRQAEEMKRNPLLQAPATKPEP